MIADEPTTALDVTTQAQILRLHRTNCATSATTGVLFITHDFGVVAEIADRVVVMQHGRIVEQGQRCRGAAPPAHAYTPQAAPRGAARRFQRPAAPATKRPPSCCRAQDLRVPT